MATKYTGLILASGIKNGDPSQVVLEALAPFSITVLSSELMTVRDRFVFSLLIELIPDHQESISTDLDAITELGEIDIAYEFQAFDFAAALGRVPITRELRIIGTKLTPEDLFTIASTLNSTNALYSMKVGSTFNYSLSTWLVDTSLADLDANLQGLKEILHTRGLSFASTTAIQSAGKEIAFLLDMDSTFINEEVIDVIARIAGAETEVAAITERAMQGELDFAESLKERVMLLKGQPVSILSQARDQITFTEGALDLVHSVHAAGGRIGIVSGGFHDVIDELLAPLGLDLVIANRLGRENGLLTGLVEGPIIDRAAKAIHLKNFALGSKFSVAIGDGANDLDMINAADVGVAFCAKETLRRACDVIVEERDLRLVLALIGL
jgi:phosphoserine phosphatase